MTCIFDSPLRLCWSRNNLAVFRRLLVAGFPGCGGTGLLCALLDTQQHLACHQVLKPVIAIVSPSSLPNLHQPGPDFGGPGPYGDSAGQVDIWMGYQFISWKCALDLLVCGSPPVLPGAEEQDIGSQRGSTDRYQSSGELYDHGV